MLPASQNLISWEIWGGFERILALAALLALAPLLLVIGIVIVILSQASPLIAHRRLGRGGRPFWMLKFRTMWRRGARPGTLRLIEYIVDESGPQRKKSSDRRICSCFARFCRRHSIDELPQLVNVLHGEMSLVGPRPITVSEWTLHYRSGASEVLNVKPGLSGLWQVKGRSRLTYQQRRELDLALVRNRSLSLYLRILLWTVPEIWAGRNAW